MLDQLLYRAILDRKSVRRFMPAADAEVLARAQEACGLTNPLVPENQFSAAIHALQPDRNLVSLLGAYGRLVAPPYVIVPAIAGGNHPFIDLGFRSQQIVIALTQLGLGSCYVGALSCEDRVRKLYNLSADQRVGALIAFGYPTSSAGGKAFNLLVRSVAGATNKLASDRLYYADMYLAPEPPPPVWAPLVEAARSSPSAVNAQPWRFIGRGNHLFILTQRHSRKYGNGVEASYKFFDCGLCIANIRLAMQALDIQGSLRLCSEPEEGAPAYPQDYQLLAELVIG
jgi:hypothetical protein